MIRSDDEDYGWEYGPPKSEVGDLSDCVKCLEMGFHTMLPSFQAEEEFGSQTVLVIDNDDGEPTLAEYLWAGVLTYVPGFRRRR